MERIRIGRLFAVLLIASCVLTFSCAIASQPAQASEAGIVKAQKKIEKAVTKGSKWVQLKSCKVTKKEAFQAYGRANYNSVDCMLKAKSDVVYSMPNSRYVTKMRIYYQSKTYTKKLKAAAGEVVAGVASLSEVEKARVIHDRIGNVCVYDYVAYETGVGKAMAGTPYGCLVKGKAICQGYAEAYQLCAKMIGLDCVVVIYPGVHAWNAVKVNGKWYYLDITWDDENDGTINYAYFLKGSVTMADVKDHEAQVFRPGKVSVSTNDYPIDLDVWGPQDRPTYSWGTYAPARVFNSATGNPLVGDERDFVSIREAETNDAFVNELTAKTGKYYEVRVYYHNDADPALNESGKGIAAGVKLAVSTGRQVKAGKRCGIRGVISAANTAISCVWDSAYITCDEDAKIYYVADSAVIHNSGSANGSKLDMKSMFSSDGVALSYWEDAPGVIPAGSDFAGYVTFQIAVKKS